MIYFDNAATMMPKKKGVLKRYKKAFPIMGNASRSAHYYSSAAADAVFSCRSMLSSIFGTAEQLTVLCHNCTYALNMAIKGLIAQGTVLVSCFEHNAVMRPLYALEARQLIKIKMFDVDINNDDNTMQNFKDSLTEEVTACVVTHCSNVCGYRLPVEQMSSLTKPRGIVFICDGAQGAGVFDISLDSCDIDVYCLPGHKGLGGPLGTGAMLINEKSDLMFETIIEGGSGSFSTDREMPPYLPERLEAGTVNSCAFHALGAALSSFSTISKKERQIYSYLLDGIKNIDNITLYGAPQGEKHIVNHAPILLFNHSSFGSEELSARLSDYDVCVRGGLHCSPVSHEKLGTLSIGGGVRVSLSPFNTFGEVDRFLTVLSRVSRYRSV